MKAFARDGDFWSGLALAALGAYIVLEAHGWDYMSEDGPGPGFFPTWYGSLMVALSLGLVLRSVLRAPAPGTREGVRWREVGRAFLCWTAFVASIVLMNVTGFTVALALLAWFIVAFMARRPQRIAVPVALGGAALFYAVFVFGLDLNLPRGWLF